MRDRLIATLHQLHSDAKGKTWYPLYEAVENFVLSTARTARGAVHIRSQMDLQRVMVIVWLSTFPAMFWGMYNLGWQSLSAMREQGTTGVGDWHQPLIELLGATNPDSIIDCFAFGAVYFVPLYATVFLAGAVVEIVTAIVRKKGIEEGFFVSSVLFALASPPDLPLWMAALGMTFGILIGKEIFGGTGFNVFNPALVGRAFVYFAYPSEMSGNEAWFAIDGITAATPLAIAAESGNNGLAVLAWGDAAIGLIPGSVGEVSAVACFIGLAVLLITRIASWRIVLGCLVGSWLTVQLCNAFADGNADYRGVPFQWHLVTGGYAFGLTFMATEPVTAAHTNIGRYIYGAMIGVVVIVVRVFNPGFAEGMMLAILFANAFAPLCDRIALAWEANRRAKYFAAIHGVPEADEKEGEEGTDATVEKSS